MALTKAEENNRMDIELKNQKNLKRIQDMNLMNDSFMTACLQENIVATERVLKVIMNRDDFQINDVKTQFTIKNLFGRSVRLDVYATDKNGKKYNIEIQQEEKGASPKRARFNSALIDGKELPAGDKVEQLPETYVVFITETDVLKAGLPIYHIDRCITETGELFQDEAHIIYVNGEIQDETPLGRLMHDFHCKNPNGMYYKELADAARYFKEDKEGVKKMCKIMDEVRAEGLVEGQAIELLKSVENIQKNLKLSVQEVLNIMGKTEAEYKAAKSLLQR